MVDGQKSIRGERIRAAIWVCPIADPRVVGSVKNQLGRFLRELPDTVTVGVYLDDISLSSDDRGAMEAAYNGVVERVEPSGFLLNQDKVVPPTASIEIFNCGLRTGFSEVLQTRRDTFYAVPRTPFSEDGFEDYCKSVRRGNAAP
jgi:hypothetical protein